MVRGSLALSAGIVRDAPRVCRGTRPGSDPEPRARGHAARAGGLCDDPRADTEESRHPSGVRRIRRRIFSAAPEHCRALRANDRGVRHPGLGTLPPREHARASRRARRRRRSSPRRLFPRPSCLDSTRGYSSGNRPFRYATATAGHDTACSPRGSPRDSRYPRSRETRGSRLDDARAPSSLTTRPPSASARSHARKTPTSSPATT